MTNDEEIIISVKIDGVNESAKTLGELKTAIALLEEQLGGMTFGSAAFNAQKNQIEELKNEYKNLSKSAIQSAQETAAEEAKHIEERKKKYKEFGENLAKLAKGVVEVGTGIALAFGASKESTEEFEKSLASIIGISSAVKGGIELVQRSVALLGGPLTIAIGLVGGLIAALSWLTSSESEYEKTVRETTEAIKEQEEASKSLTAALTLHYDLEIAKARQAGKDVTDLQRQKIEASIKHLETETKNLIQIDKLREASFQAEVKRNLESGGIQYFIAQKALADSKDKDSEVYKSKKELHNKIIASEQAVKKLEIDLINFNTDAALKATDEEKKANDKSVENYKKAQAEKEKLLKERLANERAEREYDLQQEREAIAAGNAYNKAQQEAEDARIKAVKEQFDKENLEAAAYVDEEALKQHVKTKEELLKEDIDLANRRIDNVTSYVNAASSLTSSLFELTNNLGKQDDASKLERAKRQFNITKAVNIAEAAINGAKAITKGIAEFGPPPSPLGIAAIITAGAITAAQIAAISSRKFDGGGGSSAPSIPSIGGASSGASAKQPNDTSLFGTAGAFNNVTQPNGANGNNGMNIKVSISESEITKTQNAVYNYREAVAL